MPADCELIPDPLYSRYDAILYRSSDDKRSFADVDIADLSRQIPNIEINISIDQDLMFAELFQCSMYTTTSIVKIEINAGTTSVTSIRVNF